MARAPDGKVAFVRHALPGERVLAQVTAHTASFLRADAVQVLTPSADRVAPPCPHAGPGRCGGCDFQHVAPAAQRRLKAARIAEQLARLAGTERTVVVEAVPGDEAGLGWRSRVRLAVAPDGSPGFRRHRSHELELVEACPVASPAVAATGALSARWPGVSQLEVATATGAGAAQPTGADPGGTEGTGGTGQAVITVSPRGRAVPPLPDLPCGLVVARHRPPAAGRRARHRGRADVPGVGRRVLAGPRRRSGGTARGRARPGRGLPRCTRGRPLRRGGPVLGPAGGRRGPGRLGAGRRA